MGDSSDPRAEASFVELLRVAAEHAEGAAALADAWTELPREPRGRLLDAIVDAELAPASTFQLLAAVLAVETDLELATRIADAMKARASAGGAPTSAELCAFAAGDEEEGALVLVRGLHGPFVESLALAWRPPVPQSADPALEWSFEPFARSDGVGALVSRWAARTRAGGLLAPLAIERAMELLAAVVWTEHRRTGRLPSGLHRFSDLLV